MGEDSHEVQTSAPSVTVDRKSGAQLALALTVFALVLTTNSIINESWLTQTSGEELIVTDNFGLLDFNVEQCDGNNCTKQVDSFASAYDNCTKTFEELGFNQSAIDEACSDINTTHTAGLTATVLLSISAITLLVASVFHVRNMVGLTSKIGNIVSISGGALTVLGILTWYTILPDTESSPDWGQGLWLAIISGLLAILAGFSGVLQSWIDGPPRMRAKGVRSDTGMSEFVLKESSCGDQALSILVDDSLVRVVRIERRGASPYVKDVLAAKRDSYTGFSHQRLDWLDDFKGVWWVVSGACLVSAVMISNLFLIPFTVGVILVILQLMDPERFVISTSSGNHPFYINRWRSNRELTNLAMDLVDNAMISVLRGDELDTTILDSKAEQISNRFSAMQKKQQQEDKEANERKAALLEAANAQVVEPPQQSPPVLQTPADLPPPPTTTPGQTQESEVEESPQADEIEESTEAEATTETAPEQETDEHTQAEEAPQTETLPAPPSTSQIPPPPSSPPPSQIPPPPSSPPPSQLPPPPSQLPPPPSQLPPPPSQLPPPPSQLPPPPSQLPPPPSTMPPSPGMGMPLPPPPSGAMPAMPIPAQTMPPPPVVVQAAPREDNLSDDEKDDLLGDLSS